MYNYREALEKDIKQYIKDNHINFYDYDDLDDLGYELEYKLMITDEVTGKPSGSYTFDRWTAQEYVLDNIDLLDFVVEMGGIDNDTIAEKFLANDFEYFDVVIRCYLMPSVLWDVIAGIKEELCSYEIRL